MNLDTKTIAIVAGNLTAAYFVANQKTRGGKTNKDEVWPQTVLAVYKTFIKLVHDDSVEPKRSSTTQES